MRVCKNSPRIAFIGSYPERLCPAPQKETLMQQITDSHQQIERSEAIYHEHFLMGYLFMKAFCQIEIFTTVCGHSEEISHKF